MKYYYLATDGTTAGPEPLSTLTALMAQGVVSPATLVVPAGGEDWTPLARVLRYFYQDEAGAAAGPVAFSELNRLHQVAALAAQAWVLEEGGTEWKALSAILTAGGVTVNTPAPQVVNKVFRPQAAGKTTAKAGAGAQSANPYAAPAAQGGGRQVIVRRAMGGLKRGPFFLGLLLVFIVLVAAVFVTLRTTLTALDKARDGDALWNIFLQYLLALKIIMVVTYAGVVVCLGMRIKNIGWSQLLLLPYILPAVLPLLAGAVQLQPWMVGAWGLASLLGMILFIPIASLPPGYHRHKRLDTAAKIIPVVILLVLGGLFTLGYFENQKQEKRRAEELKAAVEKEKEKEKEAAEAQQADPKKP